MAFCTWYHNSLALSGNFDCWIGTLIILQSRVHCYRRRFGGLDCWNKRLRGPFRGYTPIAIVWWQEDRFVRMYNSSTQWRLEIKIGCCTDGVRDSLRTLEIAEKPVEVPMMLTNIRDGIWTCYSQALYFYHKGIMCLTIMGSFFSQVRDKADLCDLVLCVCGPPQMFE